MYFKCFQASLLFFQCCLLFPLIYFGERYARVGQGGDCTGEGASPGSRENTKQHDENQLGQQSEQNYLKTIFHMQAKILHIIRSINVLTENIFCTLASTNNHHCFWDGITRMWLKLRRQALKMLRTKFSLLVGGKKFAMYKTSGVMQSRKWRHTP